MIYLVIIGVIVLAIGFSVKKSNSPLTQFAGTIKMIGAGIIIVGAVLASIVQINPGEIGVQKLFGKVNNNILESGLNVVNPLVDVVTFDTKTQNYTMSGVIA